MVGKQLDNYGSSAQLKFKKKAAKVSMLLGFRKRTVSPSPSNTPDKRSRRMIQQVSDYLDKKVHPSHAEFYRPAEIQPTRERFDKISGDKEVFFAHTLNYAYLDSSPVTIFLRIDSAIADTIHVKIRVQWIVSSLGLLELCFEVFLYE